MVAGWSVACGLLPGAEPGLSPGPKLEDVPIVFASPDLLTVKAGETLAILAKRHRVRVEELRSWNGLTTDTIEVGQVLLVWTPPPAPPKVAAAPAPTGLRASLERALSGAPAVESDAPSATQAGGAEDGAAAPVAAGVGSEAPTEPSAPAQRVTIDRPALAGLFGMQVGTDVDLEAAAAGMERHDADLGGGGLGERSLGTGNQADDLVLAKREMRDLGPNIPDVPVSPPRLSKPAAKSCLRGPSASVAESGVVTSGGLSVGQINAGMGQISKHTVRCFPGGTEGSYAVIVELTVGCNGQVSNVFLVNGGVVPTRVTSCIQQTLSYASFPAHSIPNGFTFQYPMKFSF
ncbi:MAG: LysM peptidoglycan-binding domain-containing protein [Myxococcota bacterium]